MNHIVIYSLRLGPFAFCQASQGSISTVPYFCLFLESGA